MNGSDKAKKAAARQAADLIQTGMTIGLGSGTTVYWLIRELSERVQRGLHVKAVATSNETTRLATESRISILELSEVDRLPLAIDGSDEIDEAGNLIKGGGGALLREKIVAAASDQLIIIADSTKLVPQLGRFPLPVEVIPAAYRQVRQQIVVTLGCDRVDLRKKDGRLFTTEHQNFILDCHFLQIGDSAGLNIALHLIPGVVETGLFINMANRAIVGFEDGTTQVKTFR